MTVKETKLIFMNIDWFYSDTIAVFLKDVAMDKDDWWMPIKQIDTNIFIVSLFYEWREKIKNYTFSIVEILFILSSFLAV